LRERALGLYPEHYGGLSAAHAAELLAVEHQVPVSRQTLWRWLKSAGRVVQCRQVCPHRIRRPRRSCEGDLVQMDGSTHAWLGQGHDPCMQFVMIDDASSWVWARFYARADTASAFDLLGGYARRYGLPMSLYVDRDSIYRVNDEQARKQNQQAGKAVPLTQFRRVMAEYGGGVDLRPQPAGQGLGGTGQLDAAGPAGEGTGLDGHHRSRGGQHRRSLSAGHRLGLASVG
jgi:hypothetical protein